MVAAALLLACCFAGSCKKDDPVQDPPFPSSRLSATVDGHSFLSTDLSAVLSGTWVSILGKLNAGNSKESAITLTMPHFNGLGTYPIDSANKGSYTEVGGSYHAQSGNIIVTTDNSVHIVGKFSFEAAAGNGSSKAVTNGSFDFYK